MTPAKYEPVRMSDDSWRIENNGVRSFLFTGTDRTLLVDTGFGMGNLREVVSKLTPLPVMLVNTHADSDHTGGNALFDEAYMHPAEFPYYGATAPASAAVKALWEGDIIDLGIRKFEVVLIPGHTPGSIALIDRDNTLLIAGDSISDTPIFMFGNMRSLQAHICSMRKLLAMRDCFSTIYPSHGPIPVDLSMISKLIEGATCILNGEVEGQPPPFDIPAKIYKACGAAFFYDK